MTISDNTLSSGLLPRTDNTRAWPILVNGKPLPELIGEPVRTLSIDCVRDPMNPDGTRLGRLNYGAEPGKDGTASAYDTWVYTETGGAVTLPYAIVNGELYVGVVEQRRHVEVHPEYNPSGMILNAPRGSHNVKREATATAREELKEEVGVFVADTVRLHGENINANNAWFAYMDELEGGTTAGQGGVTCFAVEVNAKHLLANVGPMGGVFYNTYRMDEKFLGERPKGSPYEMIGKCVFVTWHTALRLRDGFTHSATLRLLAFLAGTGRAKISF
jgi:hypothetical protein